VGWCAPRDPSRQGQIGGAFGQNEAGAFSVWHVVVFPCLTPAACEAGGPTARHQRVTLSFNVAATLRTRWPFAASRLQIHHHTRHHIHNVFRSLLPQQQDTCSRPPSRPHHGPAHLPNMYACIHASRSSRPAGGCAARPAGQQQARRAITCAVAPRGPGSGLQRQVSASAYVGSWGEQQQQFAAEQRPQNPLHSMFTDLANGFFAGSHSEDASWCVCVRYKHVKVVGAWLLCSCHSSPCTWHRVIRGRDSLDRCV